MSVYYYCIVIFFFRMTFEVMFISCITLTSNCVFFIGNEMNLGHLYRALRLRASATQSEIKSAYYRLCQIYHPDKAKDSSNSVQRFRLINDAYQALMKALASNKNTQTKILNENPGECETLCMDLLI